MKEYGGPAFPQPSDITGRGITMRDYFAGQALAGLARGVGLDLAPDDLARRAYRIADAMLAERAKQ